MEGELPGVAAKKLALERAAAVAGVHSIVDRIRVEPARRMGDAEIRDHLRDTLLSEPAFQGCALRLSTGRPPRVAAGGGEPGGCALELSVEEGVVTMSGEVPSLTHKRLAGVLAWWVPGTRDVVNGIEVVPPEEDGDAEVTDAVRIVLEKDPLVDAADVQVSTHAREVTLEGAVVSPEQREMAEADAWYVFGVDRVVDRLEVRAPTGRAGPR
jgi:osmotically-inducible protein OsmY